MDVRPTPAVNGEPPPCPPASPQPQEPLDDAAFERRHLPAELEERRRLYQAAGKPSGAAGGGGTGGGSGHGRGRPPRAPDTPRATEAGGDAQRPRILRYMYLLEVSGVGFEVG